MITTDTKNLSVGNADTLGSRYPLIGSPYVTHYPYFESKDKRVDRGIGKGIVCTIRIYTVTGTPLSWFIISMDDESCQGAGPVYSICVISTSVVSLAPKVSHYYLLVRTTLIDFV